MNGERSYHLNRQNNQTELLTSFRSTDSAAILIAHYQQNLELSALSYFTEVIEEYVQRRDVLIEGLNAIDGVLCPKPSGAFYCIAQLPVDDADIFAQWLLEAFSWKNKTVMVAPAAGFYSTPEIGKQQIRIAYVLNTSDLKDAIRILEEALKVYPGTINRK